MKKRIAIPTESGVLCSHFGHCESFYIADVEDNKIISSSFVTPPAHEPGLYPAWIKQQGVNEVICGGIGEQAKVLFAAQNITLYIGADMKDPEKLIQDHLNNSLKTGQNACNH
ncbi:MAG: NifB/NifX family molybdenum-iron cluster-binding protein [Bacteroidales bacterium]